MTDAKKHQTFLNIKMNTLWKGIVSSLITTLLVYLTLILNGGFTNEQNTFEFPSVNLILYVAYCITALSIWVIFLYTLASIITKRKLYHLPAFAISTTAIIVLLLKF